MYMYMYVCVCKHLCFFCFFAVYVYTARSLSRHAVDDDEMVNIYVNVIYSVYIFVCVSMYILIMYICSPPLAASAGTPFDDDEMVNI